MFFFQYLGDLHWFQVISLNSLSILAIQTILLRVWLEIFCFLKYDFKAMKIGCGRSIFNLRATLYQTSDLYPGKQQRSFFVAFLHYTLCFCYSVDLFNCDVFRTKSKLVAKYEISVWWFSGWFYKFFLPKFSRRLSITQR